MIEIKTASNQTKETFQDYDDLFEHITEIENRKMLELEPDFRSMQWSFTAYSPNHVQALYKHLKDHDPAVRHAFENQLPLIEICTGDFTDPEYVVDPTDLKLNYLKKKWVLGFCDAHGVSVAPIMA